MPALRDGVAHGHVPARRWDPVDTRVRPGDGVRELPDLATLPPSTRADEPAGYEVYGQSWSAVAEHGDCLTLNRHGFLYRLHGVTSPVGMRCS